MSKAKKYVFAEKATQYAKDVLGGAIPVCKYVKQACQRHLDDIEKAKSDDFPYEWSEKSADLICAFASKMVHVKGKWAGKKIVLEPWQCFSIGVPFGWLRKSDGMRRFREIYEEIPRKNSKSTIGACIGNYMFAADNEPGAEVYSGATSLEQAMEVFRPAWLMVNNNQAFKSHFKLELGGTQKNPGPMYRLSDGSRFSPVIGKPGDGSSPSCGIVDEYHEHKTPDLYDTMKTGMGARSQPMLAVITTAGVDTSGPCYAKRDEAIKVLGGVLENDELFALIYTVDEEDDWLEWATWEKANPNLGVSIYRDFLEARLREATQTAHRQNIIKCKHLNIWANAGSAWINMVKWNACKADVRLEDFAGEKCWVGVDLASSVDFTAMMFLFKRGDELFLFGKYYLPEETVQLPENAHYQRWVAEGKITATPGARTDYHYLKDDLLGAAKVFNIQELAYDKKEAEFLMQEIRLEVSFPCIEYDQSAVMISGPMKEFEALYMSRKLRHDGDDVLAWQASNVILRSSRTKAFYPSKERNENKIDGIVAAIMALARAMLAEPKQEAWIELWD